MILITALPTPAIIAIIAVAVILVGGIVAMLAITLPIAKKIHANQFVKETPDKWLRVCSDETNEEQVMMWNTGKAWAEEHKDQMTELQIENEGLKLYGEYYDFGSRKCALIIPGRAECLVYSYYFAISYYRAGYNVLVIDQRARGLSDGTIDSVGAHEHKDSIKWINYVTDRFGIEEFALHGICMGASQCILIGNSPECPAVVKNFVIDGMFISFRETFKNHCTYIHKPTFPVTDEVMLRMWTVSGYNQWAMAPRHTVKKFNKRILFIYGKKDVFSRPDKSQYLFDHCASKDKKMVWFDEGAHSHLRINNVEKYDKTIADFLNGEAEAEA